MASGSGSFNSSSHASGTVDEVARVKILCSYGSQISYKGKLVYEGGITKIVELDRFITYPNMISRLSDLFFHAFPADVVIKYHFPGEDLLVSVANQEDLENMMQECDNLRRRSPLEAAGSTPWLRLFIDPPTVRFNDDFTLLPPPLQQLAAAIAGEQERWRSGSDEDCGNSDFNSGAGGGSEEGGRP